MKNNWLALLAGVLVFAVIGLSLQCMRLESAADAAEAHAAAADDRAGTCEAKFSYSTVIVMASPSPLAGAASSPGVNLYHGIFRISLNAPASFAGAPQPAPAFIIPAEVTPQLAGAVGEASYYWVNDKTHDQRGPYKIQ